jgi:biopolymer transport protein ExbD
MAVKSHLEEMPVLNLTAMIDILFLLIIFFMVGTTFIESDKQIKLEVPQVTPGGALTAAPQKRVVTVYQDGQITLDGGSVSLDQLTKRLAAARSQFKGLGVLVRGDRATPFERVASVLNACKKAGIADLGISVRVANTEKKNARR